jgi:hypothetical protein
MFFANGLKKHYLAYAFWPFGLSLIALSNVAGAYLDKRHNGQFEWPHSNYCSNYPVSDFKYGYAFCVNSQYAYFGWNFFLYLSIMCSVIWKQEHSFRVLIIGSTLQIWLSSFLDDTMGIFRNPQLVACILVPSVLVVTETLRVYGHLKAVDITTQDKKELRKCWNALLKECKDCAKTRKNEQKLDERKNVCSHNLKDFEELEMKLCAFDPSKIIVDHSRHLGRWYSQFKPYPCHRIRQPINDLDTLLHRAVEINDVFQIWMESLFDSSKTLDPSGCQERSAFKGRVTRGPVKRLDRIISKV